jgi:hypothetical protein
MVLHVALMLPAGLPHTLQAMRPAGFNSTTVACCDMTCSSQK